MGKHTITAEQEQHISKVIKEINSLRIQKLDEWDEKIQTKKADLVAWYKENVEQTPENAKRVDEIAGNGGKI
jgi:CRISPR/Cas system CSM-associated protein Csm4 (group 5 of RAMP superfamily)